MLFGPLLKEQSNLKSQLYQEHVKVEDRLKCEITRAENRLEARQNELEVPFQNLIEGFS